MPTSITDQLKVFKEGLIDFVSEEELRQRLGEKRSLRIKYGADPSTADLHLGHTVPLRKLKQLQDLGHQVVFIIGDFTARIGDPSQRNEIRPMLSQDQVQQNAKTYEEQVFKILDRKKTEIRYNSEWLDQMKPQDFLHLTSQYTVARLLERDDFQNRYHAKQPIALVEFLYPLLQGYDSVVVKSDIELGGTDQKFNLLVGRELQKTWSQKPQMVMTLPLLEGTDGVKKMSKSFGNAININDSPKEIFGKVMSVPDSLIPRYFQYASGMNAQEYQPIVEKLCSADPREAKAKLGEQIVGLYYGREKGAQAREEFDRIFRDKGLPDEIQTVMISQSQLDIVSLLMEAGLVTSKGEGRRLIQQGGVKIEQEKVADQNRKVQLTKQPILIQCGKRKFARVKVR
ncbi:MAG: tyrosine--tRNA ligase [Candidatus Omnitrophica bacterium]|nr:tyrosine--tRNA ligase [Candidatus Omnitrophota bacterium]